MKILTKNNKVSSVILSYADATHYLLLLREGKKEDIACNEQGEKIVFSNIQEAKLYLLNFGFSEAILVMQTAYDEMIGSPAEQPSELKIPLDV